MNDVKKIIAPTGNEVLEAVDGSDGVIKYKEHKRILYSWM